MLFPELLEVRDSEPHPAAENMAIDEALLRAAERPTLRVYRWREATLSFGYFGRLAEAESAAQGRALIRRWTGGGRVDHGADLTYTLVVPRKDAFLQNSAAESYRRIHAALAEWLAAQGMHAEVAAAAASPTAGGNCFAAPVQHDLTLGGAKIAGAAQRRTRWGLLHQGSILLPSPAQLSGESLAAAFSHVTHVGALSPEILREAQTLVVEKYGTPEWLRKF